MSKENREAAGDDQANAKVLPLAAELRRALAQDSSEYPAFLQTERRIREALAEALKPDAPVAAALAESLCRELPQLNPEQAKLASVQICVRRGQEQKQYLSLLERDTRFHSRTALDTIPAPKENAPNAKFTGILAQADREGGPEPIVHILAQADGQERWHRALAEAWKPGGQVHQALEKTLLSFVPEAAPERVRHAAAFFIQDRHTRAVQATELFKAESPVVKDAIAISGEATKKAVAAADTGAKESAKPATPQPAAPQPAAGASADNIGQDLAFGLQQTAACFSTDFIDPPVSRFLQRRWGVPEHDVTHAHVWYGEIIGDLSALPLYIAEKVALRGPINAVKNFCKNLFDSSYEKSGRKHLESWAKEHHVEKDSPEYRQKLDEYKTFQASNTVDSSLVAFNATTVNVLSQKYVLHNHQPLKVILGSKLVGAAATMGLMLGLRRAIPTATENLDRELSDRYFSPVIRHVQTQLGFAPGLPGEEEKSPPPAPSEPWHQNLSDLAVGGAAATATGLLGASEGGFSLRNPKQLGMVAGAGVVGALGLRALAPDTMQHLNNELNNRYRTSRKERHTQAKASWAERAAEGDSTPAPAPSH